MDYISQIHSVEIILSEKKGTEKRPEFLAFEGFPRAKPRSQEEYAPNSENGQPASVSPNVRTFCNFEPQIWLEMITSRDVPKVLVLKAQIRLVMRSFLAFFDRKRSHHVMDASGWEKCPQKQLQTRFGLFSGSGAHSWRLRGSPGRRLWDTLFGVFSDSSGVLGRPLCQAGRACWSGPMSWMEVLAKEPGLAPASNSWTFIPLLRGIERPH